MGERLTIGDVARRTGVAPTALRFYEKVGLIPAPERTGGRRRYDEAILVRLEVIRLCKAAGFTLGEIAVLMDDDTLGRPMARALAQAKLVEIDAQIASLARARGIVEWGMQCTCPSIDACTCGIHRTVPA